MTERVLSEQQILAAATVAGRAGLRRLASERGTDLGTALDQVVDNLSGFDQSSITLALQELAPEVLARIETIIGRDDLDDDVRALLETGLMASESLSGLQDWLKFGLVAAFLIVVGDTGFEFRGDGWAISKSEGISATTLEMVREVRKSIEAIGGRPPSDPSAPADAHPSLDDQLESGRSSRSSAAETADEQGLGIPRHHALVSMSIASRHSQALAPRGRFPEPECRSQDPHRLSFSRQDVLVARSMLFRSLASGFGDAFFGQSPRDLYRKDISGRVANQLSQMGNRFLWSVGYYADSQSEQGRFRLGIRLQAPDLKYMRAGKFEKLQQIITKLSRGAGSLKWSEPCYSLHGRHPSRVGPWARKSAGLVTNGCECGPEGHAHPAGSICFFGERPDGKLYAVTAAHALATASGHSNNRRVFSPLQDDVTAATHFGSVDRVSPLLDLEDYLSSGIDGSLDYLDAAAIEVSAPEVKDAVYSLNVVNNKKISLIDRNEWFERTDTENLCEKVEAKSPRISGGKITLKGVIAQLLKPDGGIGLAVEVIEIAFSNCSPKAFVHGDSGAAILYDGRLLGMLIGRSSNTDLVAGSTTTTLIVVPADDICDPSALNLRLV